MDVHRRLIAIMVVLLLVAVTGAAIITGYVQEQQQRQDALQQQTEQLRGAAILAYNAITLTDMERDQSDAAYLATRPTVGASRAQQSPRSVHDDVLEPYRQVRGLAFIVLLTPQRKVINTAAANGQLTVPITGIPILTATLTRQQDAASFWDGPRGNEPYIVASSPVLVNQRLVGAVVVGQRLDNSYVTTLSRNMATVEVAIVENGALLSVPGDVGAAFEQAKVKAPYTPRELTTPTSDGLPNGSWHLVDWQVGKERYRVVTRPLNNSSRAELAVGVPVSSQAVPPPAGLVALASRLAGPLHLASASAFVVAFQLLLVLVLVLFLLVLVAFAVLTVKRTLQPLDALAERVERFLRDAKWPAGAEKFGGSLGRLSAAVTTLAHDAAGWLRRSREQEGRLESVLNSVQTGIVLSDARGRVELVNPSARQLLGLDASAATVPMAMAAAPVNGQPFEAHNGRIINAVSTAVSGPGGETAGLVTVLDDLTRERELERVRTDFLSVVSHELRTPLTAVKGSLDLLLDGEAGDLDGLQHRFLQTARRNTQRLIALVNDLLDLSRIEAGQVRLNTNPIDLRRVVDDVAASLAALFDGKRQVVALELPPTPVLVQADRRRLEQVLTNLLGNAATYTPEESRIAVGVEHDEAANQAVLRVSDSGPGISAEDRDHLFEKFYRGGNALTREEGGTGLGLAIVKSLVELHHGTVMVASEPKQGATFVVRLPLAGDQSESARRG